MKTSPIQRVHDFSQTLSLVVLSVVIMGSACSKGTLPPEDAVARVGNRVITRTELQEEISKLTRGRQASPVDAEARKHILQGLIDRELLLQKAMAERIDKDPDFLAALEQSRSKLLSQTLLKNALQMEPVTEEQLRAYYLAHPEEFGGGERVKLREIILRDKVSGGRRTAEEAQSLAARLTRQIRAGAGFGGLAQKYSDAPSAKHGGKTGFLSRSQLDVELARSIERFKPGEIAGPIPVRGGVALVQLIERRTFPAKPFEQAEAEIRKRLLPSSVREAFGHYMEKLRQETPVEIYEPALKQLTMMK